MNNKKSHSINEIEQLKDFYKSELLNMNYFKTPDGKQLYELTLSDLKETHKRVKAENEK